MRWRLPTAAALIVTLLLAVAGALIGLVIHGVVGSAVGAAIVALCGMAAGYVPTTQDRAARRRAKVERAAAERAAARAALREASEPPLEVPKSGPSQLLRPELTVVEFAGRLAELAELRTWCALHSSRAVRALVGGGGVGKTRLALKIGEEWEAAGGTKVMVGTGNVSKTLATARAVTSGPLLLVVDYAESRDGLGDLLRAVLDDPGPIRVLLLARSLGEWWDRLSEDSAPAVAQLRAQADPIYLTAPIDDIPDQDLVKSAVPCFAAKLGVAAPAGVEFDLPPGRVPVLVLHTAALVAVLRSMTTPPGSLRVAVTEGVLGELLVHEARYWRRAARSYKLRVDGRILENTDGPILKAAVAAAILLGAVDLEEAAAVAGRIPDLAAASAGDLRQWARWLRELYPRDQAGRLSSVQPDLLAEHHVVTQLDADPTLAQAMLRDLTTEQAIHALTVLTRAWALHDGAGRVIEMALRADLAGLAIPAAEVAVRTPARLGSLLGAALSDAPVTLEELIKIEAAMPYPSVALAEADLSAVERIRRELPPGADKPTIALWDDKCGKLLSQVGRFADALGPSRKAVAIRRELTAAMPDRYRPDLAHSLSNLGAYLSELSRPQDALAPTEEAIAILQELADAMPDRYRPELARSVSNLAIYLAESGRPADALPPAEEAVAIFRDMAAAIPNQYRPDLATALTNLGEHFALANRPSDALRPANEAVAIFQELAVAMPDRYRPDLADSLNSLGAWLSQLGRLADALPPAEEAVAIFEELAAAMPDRYLRHLERSQANVAAILACTEQ